MNLPLKHPVNMAYEAATADKGCKRDRFLPLRSPWSNGVNYNRDMEVFSR